MPSRALSALVLLTACGAAEATPRSSALALGPPAHDVDDDGVLDAVDRCPRLPETMNGREDDDGCPDRGDTSLAPPIEISEVISFAPGSATLTDGSVLDLVANLLAGNPQIMLVELLASAEPGEPGEGHLAADRGRAVMDALVERGVEASRLRARTLGEPGRSVRFVIVSRADDP